MEVQKHGKVEVVDSRLLHKELQVRTQHSEWMRRRIDLYGFVKGEDYFLLSKNGYQTGRGGHNWKTYLLTHDMSKELAMLENNEIGKKVRRFFIKRDKELRSIEAVRIAGIKARRTLTDEIRDSGENERMHGHGFSTYTNLAYKLTGIQKGNRDILCEEDLKRLEDAEALMKALLKTGQSYSEIKETMMPIFTH